MAGAAVALAVLLPPPVAAQGAVATPGAKVLIATQLRPDTVEIGDRFTFAVTLAVPDGARIEWGAITDTAAWVAQMGAVKVIDEGTRLGLHRERAEYTLTAWNVGDRTLGVPDASVRMGATITKVPLGAARVFVRSVLPGDTTLRVPKPARDLLPRDVPWWQRWWPALLVLLALAALWWYRRRRRHRAPGAGGPPPLSPFQRAMHDFERLERLHLADAGESGRYVALATDVMRGYLAARIPNAVLALTSSELLLVALDDDRVPRDRLISFLADADGVKFAARGVTAERARALAAAARSIVMEIERAETVRQAAEQAARQAAEQEAARARVAAEETARKASRKTRGGTGGPTVGAR